MLAYKQAYDCSGNPMGQLWRTNGTNGTAHARWVGWLDTIADYLLSLTDDAGALIPVVSGAGGVITNWRGEPAHEGGQLLAAASPELHARALDMLAPAAL